MTLTRIDPALPFRSAAKIWLDARSFRSVNGAKIAQYIRKTTEKSYEQYISSLNLFFGEIPLNQIHAGHLDQYQKARIEGSDPFVRKRRPNRNELVKPCPVVPKKVNQELALLKRLMKKAGAWSEENQELYEPFREDESEIPIALTQAERQLWLDTCLSRPDWNVIYWYSIVAFGTSMSTHELRGLRLGDINMHHQIVSIPPHAAKNQYRSRTLPLESAEILWCMEQLIERAKDLGASDAKHYLFPFREVPHPFDPTRPMTVSGLKKPWNEVRKASGLLGFCTNHTRHTALTHWAEAGMSIEDMMALAGHNSPKMTRHYARISIAAKAKSLRAANEKMGPQSVGPFYERKRANGSDSYIYEMRK